MAWTEKIALKLSLRTGELRLIRDETGLLGSPVFLQWLATKGFRAEVAKGRWDLFKYGQDQTIDLLLTTATNIPDFLCQVRQCSSFTFADLPYPVEQSVARNCSPTYLIALLDYLDNNPSLTVHENNEATIRQQVNSYQFNREIAVAEEKISELLATTISVNSLLKIGQLWGELIYQYYQTEQSPNVALQEKIDRIVTPFILQGGLKSAFRHPTKDLRLVHKIPHFLKEKKLTKVALLCLDCMGVAEWQILKNRLSSTKIGIGERFTFALIPTFTSISRTALYYGTYGNVFSLKSINEAKYFGEHFPHQHHQHFKQSDVISTNRLLGIEIVSKTYNFFDDLCHSTILPLEINHKQPYFQAVENYLNHSTLIEEIQILKQEGFKVFLCSDHGSVVATGNGRRFAKWLQEKFAKRAVVVPKTALLEDDQFANYEQYKLPFIKNKLVILPPRRTMFDYQDKVSINHGGITLEELVVPFIELL